MTPLIKYVAHPDLVAHIVGQFAFMKACSRPEDSNIVALQKLSLDEIFEKADAFFVEYTELEEFINAEECELDILLSNFLSQWKEITDVVAIQQNIHYQLRVLDGE